jgi:hypothetical protein
MRRREFIALAAASVAPLTVRAQQRPVPVIGYLSGVSPGPYASLAAAFREGLGDAAHADGRNVAIEYRWAEGKYDKLPALAMDLVSRKVDVIAASGGPISAHAAKKRNLGDPDRLYHRRRSGRRGSGRQSGASRRQHNRVHPPGRGADGEAARPALRIGPQCQDDRPADQPE